MKARYIVHLFGPIRSVTDLHFQAPIIHSEWSPDTTSAELDEWVGRIDSIVTGAGMLDITVGDRTYHIPSKNIAYYIEEREGDEPEPEEQPEERTGEAAPERPASGPSAEGGAGDGPDGGDGGEPPYGQGRRY